MPEVEHGFLRAILEVVGGFLTSILMKMMENSGLIPATYLLMFKLITWLSTIIFILVFPYWGTGYLIGWLLGIALLYPSGLLEPLDLVIYFIIPLIILILRLIKHVTD